MLLAESIVNLYKCNGCAWPWTHHLILQTNTDGSSFGACPPKCGGGSDDQESVWGIGQDFLSDIRLLIATMLCSVRLISVILILDAERKLFHLEIQRKAESSLDVMFSMITHVAPV